MKYIKSTNGTESMVDDEDFEFLDQWNWRLSTSGYFIHSVVGKKAIIMHRLILQKHNLYKYGLEVDHINRNRIDNRKENLRMCTSSQNKGNVGPLKSNKTGYKGVAWKRLRNQWEVHISFNKKYMFLGYFNDPKEAGDAYIKKHKELYGEYSIYHQK